MAQGARVVLVDSISHEWDGANGCLEQVDAIAERAEKAGKKPDNFSAWRTVTPMHRRFLEALLSMPAHIIVTIRAKMTYEQRKDERGRMKFEKVGLGPIQREGIEYESDIFGWLADATLTVDKTRCDRIDPGSVWPKPGADVAALLADWIEDVVPGAPASPPRAVTEEQVLAELDRAVTDGIAAKRSGNDEAPKRVLGAFTTWMRTHGVAEEPGRRAVVSWRKRVEEGAKQAQPNGEPGDTAGAAS
jgi:hypothetical protein